MTDAANLETGADDFDVEAEILKRLEPESQPEPESVKEEEQGTEAEPSEEVESTETQEETLELSTLSDLAERLGVKEEDLFNLRLTEKVNGEEKEVTLADLRKGHMMEQDYRRKTAEIADQRRAVETQAQQFQQEMSQRLQAADTILGREEKQLVDAYNRIDWNGLRQENPAEFAALRQEYQERYNAIQQDRQNVLTQTQQLQTQQRTQWESQLAETIQKERELLSTKLPEWKDTAKMQEDQKAIRAYLKAQGFQDHEISLTRDEYGRISSPGITDHRAIVLARKAMLYDQMQSKKPEVTKKVINLPKVQKPGAAKTKAEVVQAKRNEKLAKVRKTGSTQDLASLLSDIL